MQKIKGFLLGVILFSSSAMADTASQQLDKFLSNFHSMSANFQQTSIIKKSTAKKSIGTMALERPGKFRWEITSPNRQVIIADGKYLWIYDVDLEQATKQSLGKDAHSPAILLSGSTAALEERFNIIDSKQEGSKVIFNLKPKRSQDMVQRVELVFENDKLHQMSVIDNLGQKNIFTFSNVKINPSLATSLFQFHAPKGVDIISN
ncbi:MAG: outer membrane lipoprotein chaperone LolA [Gammaproteobacteria bacterium]|nr:outer membrane lipoprotein chaperone LolA [Gammaproteobacteria bacterium]